MKNTLRSLAAAGALVLMATSGALAEWKPSGPITMLIGFAAGGGADTQARMIAEELESAMAGKSSPSRQPVVVVPSCPPRSRICRMTAP